MSALFPSPLPDASTTVRGVVNTGSQSFVGAKTYMMGGTYGYGSAPITIDTGVLTNVRGLNIFNGGAGDAGVLMSGYAGQFSIDLGGYSTTSGLAGFVVGFYSTNGVQDWYVNNDAYAPAGASAFNFGIAYTVNRANNVVMSIQGATNQTAPILSLRNVAHTEIASVTAAGGLTGTGLSIVGNSATSLLKNLIAYWKLNSDVLDAFGGFNGTATALTYSTGQIGYGAIFNGSTSNIALPNITALSGGTARTIAMWVKRGAGTTIKALFSSGTAVNNGAFTIFSGRYAAGDIYVATVNNDVYTTSAGLITTSNFHHVCVVYDGGTTTTSSLRIYVDGTLQATSLASTGAAVANTTNSGFTIGYNPAFSYGSGTATDSTIDEVGAWNRALTTTEITALVNGGIGITYPFGAVVPTNQIVSGLGAGSTDVLTKIGTTVADGSVSTSASLLSVKTGIGGTEKEYVSVRKPAADFTNGVLNINCNSIVNASAISIQNNSNCAGSIIWDNSYINGGCEVGWEPGATFGVASTNRTQTYLVNSDAYSTAGLPAFNFGYAPGTNTRDLVRFTGDKNNVGAGTYAGNLLALYNGTTSKFSVDYTGNIVTSGNMSISRDISTSYSGTARWLNYGGSVGFELISMSGMGSGNHTVFQDSGGNKVTIDWAGTISQKGTDSSGTPGAATINKPTGISAVASGAASVVITNSLATTTCRVLITWLGDHGQARSWVTRATGSFTVNLSGNATSNTSFSWEISNLL